MATNDARPLVARADQERVGWRGEPNSVTETAMDDAKSLATIADQDREDGEWGTTSGPRWPGMRPSHG